MKKEDNIHPNDSHNGRGSFVAKEKKKKREERDGERTNHSLLAVGGLGFLEGKKNGGEGEKGLLL